MKNTKKRAARVAAGLPAGLSSGNSVVDQIGQMHFEGNILDHRWLNAPKLRYANGKLNINAVLVLADIVYWHRPTLVRQEGRGQVIDIRTKFSGPAFWKDYAEWADGLGLTKRQVQDAVTFLVMAGLIEREVQMVYVGKVRTNNVPVLTPIPEAIAELTYHIPAPEGGNDEGGDAPSFPFEREASSVQTGDGWSSRNRSLTPKREAPHATTGDYTKNKQRVSETRNNNNARTEINNGADAENVVVDEELLQKMRAVGVSATVARRLLVDKPDECRQQLEWLPLREMKKPCGALVASIRDSWPAPEAALERERQKQQAREAAAQREEAEKTRAQERVAKEQQQKRAEAEREQIDAFFAGLAPEEQQRIEAEVRRRLGVLANTGRGSVAALMLRRELLRPELGLG